MCPTCVSKGKKSRLAKPSIRACACVECTRWIHRDGVGAHNIALIGKQYLKSRGRPEALARPPPKRHQIERKSSSCDYRSADSKGINNTSP
ncbi:hypothetical protein K457DRAFT_15553 [Linnemannia elongata AG-77]|uniref:Uncharacterized protein n=1 Tax=Linnemannia elongata AG-77 TaxID=1314771 RepID=A0A197K9A0_9FUNG|nr:hypothetical protein K457DRAFT_15553 [Linnemannia elongata AG-77]